MGNFGSLESIALEINFLLHMGLLKAEKKRLLRLFLDSKKASQDEPSFDDVIS